MDRIEADLLIPGQGSPIDDGVVLFDGPRISYAGPGYAAPDTPGALVHQAAAVMPGMWDCHGHFFGARTFDLGRLPLEPLTLHAVRCARDLRATLAELRAIVEIAGLAERVVAAHRHGKPSIIAALQAGVRTIEHGTYLDDECCDAMRETGAILVPTRTIIEDLLRNKALVPPYALAKLEAIGSVHAEAVARAHEHQVRIAMGTDIALTGSDLPNSWGRNGGELGHLVALGLTPLEAIEAATATGPLTVGPQAPRSGKLAADYDADVITLDGDPLADIAVLADPDRVTSVWTAGRRVKSPKP